MCKSASSKKSAWHILAVKLKTANFSATSYLKSNIQVVIDKRTVIEARDDISRPAVVNNRDNTVDELLFTDK